MTLFVQRHSRGHLEYGRLAVLVVAIGLSVLIGHGIYLTLADGTGARSPNDHLAQIEAACEALGRRFGEEVLEANATYKRAMQARARATRLAEAGRTALAEPHARSALALIERTELTLERERFNRHEAEVVALQLRLADREQVSADSVARADAALRGALQAASENRWDAAREHLAHAAAAYRTLLVAGER